MIISRPLTQLKDFITLKKWEYLAIEFKEWFVDKLNNSRFSIFKIVEHKEEEKEIILDRKNNIYFSYERFLNWWWAAKNITLISYD